MSESRNVTDYLQDEQRDPKSQRPLTPEEEAAARAEAEAAAGQAPELTDEQLDTELTSVMTKLKTDVKEKKDAIETLAAGLKVLTDKLQKSANTVQDRIYTLMKQNADSINNMKKLRTEISGSNETNKKRKLNFFNKVVQDAGEIQKGLEQLSDLQLNMLKNHELELNKLQTTLETEKPLETIVPGAVPGTVPDTAMDVGGGQRRKTKKIRRRRPHHRGGWTMKKNPAYGKRRSKK